jgi:hypothetical protein
VNTAAKYWLADYYRRWGWMIAALIVLHVALVAVTTGVGLPIMPMIAPATGIMILIFELSRNPVRSLLGAPLTAADLGDALWRIAFLMPVVITLAATFAGVGLGWIINPDHSRFSAVPAGLVWTCGLMGVNTLCLTQLPCRPPATTRDYAKALLFSAPWGVQNTFAFIVPVVPSWNLGLTIAGCAGLGAAAIARRCMPAMVIDRARPAAAKGEEPVLTAYYGRRGPLGWSALRGAYLRQLLMAAIFGAFVALGRISTLCRRLKI